jgi:hypothetical protein
LGVGLAPLAKPTVKMSATKKRALNVESNKVTFKISSNITKMIEPESDESSAALFYSSSKSSGSSNKRNRIHDDDV